MVGMIGLAMTISLTEECVPLPLADMHDKLNAIRRCSRWYDANKRARLNIRLTVFVQVQRGRIAQLRASHAHLALSCVKNCQKNHVRS